MLGKQGWCGGESSRFAPVLPWFAEPEKSPVLQEVFLWILWFLTFLKFDQEWWKNNYDMDVLPLHHCIFRATMKRSIGGIVLVVLNSLKLVNFFWKLVKATRSSTGKVSNGRKGEPFQSSTYSREFSKGMPEKRMFYLHPTRNFRNFLISGKRPYFTRKLPDWYRPLQANYWKP